MRTILIVGGVLSFFFVVVLIYGMCQTMAAGDDDD